jgi:outer membrane cobalamin receptor
MGKYARLFLFLLVLVHCSRVQALAGPVQGSVTDASGGVLPRATVRLIDAAGKQRALVITDSAGRFNIDVTSCTGCSLVATLSGFQPSSKPVNPLAQMNFVLSPAPVSDTVVVTATREAAPAGQVGASVTTFTREEIERRGSILISDLVRETPGVAVIQTGGAGGVTSFFLRGGDSTYTKVLLDGIPLNEPGGTFNFGGLTTTNLARVEVVRGAQSALYGSDAMSGVIQLVTAKGVTAAPSFAGNIEAGGYGTYRGAGAIGGVSRGWDYSIGAAGTASDNRVPHSRLTNSTFSWTAGGRLTPRIELRTVGRMESGRVGTPGQTAFGSKESDAFFDHRDTAAGASLTQQLAPLWTHRVAYSYTRTRQDSTNLQTDAPYVPAYGAAKAPFAFSDFTYDSNNLLRRQFLTYQVDGRINTRVLQLVTALVDWDGERATLTDRMASTVINAERNNVGVSVQHQFIGRLGSLASSVRAEHNDSFGDKWVPRVSGVLIARRASGAWGELAIKGNAGRGVKEPTILQSFSPNAYFLGNPDLLPELATTWDAGLSQRFAGDRARIEATYFDNKYENQISTRITNFSTFASQYFNVGDTKARGLELSGEAVIVPALRVSGGYTFTDSEIVKSTAEFSDVIKTGAWAFRQPRHSAFVRAAVTAHRVAADLAGQYVGRRVDSDFSSLSPAITSSGQYWLWNASASMTVNRNIELYARIQNLGAKDYMEPLGYEAWRRTAHGGVRVRF